LSKRWFKHLLNTCEKKKCGNQSQGVITDLVASGEIKNDVDLKNFFSSADMSLKALKMVPFPTYAKLAGVGTKPRK
jgi:hypothetical protein